MSRPTRVVIIGANKFQDRLIQKAKERGYETHVFAWGAGDVGERSADYFYPISITEKEHILGECRKIHPDAICSIASDLAAPTVNFVSRGLGLTANPPECDLLATNKFLMREALAGAGIDTPWHERVYQEGAEAFVTRADIPYPVIVKPTDRSGSRAITRVDATGNLHSALERAIVQSFEGAAIVEGLIEGKEYSCESISWRGQHTMLAITEKYTTGAPHYIEVGHIEPSDLSEEEIARVWDVVSHALTALRVENGASHAEFRIGQDGRVRIIEVGARMGGDFIGSDLVSLSTGYDYLGMVLDVALGREPSFAQTDHYGAAGVRFAMDVEDIGLMSRVSETLTPIRSDMHPAMQLPATDSSNRLGYIVACASNRESLIDLFS